MQFATPLQNVQHLSSLCDSSIDIIIIGIKDHCHRMNQTFTIHEAIPLIKTIKSKDKQVFINLNRLFHQSMLDALETVFETLKNQPIDGILFADLAVFQLAEKHGLKDRLIYHAETYTTNPGDLDFWSKENIKAVILARESTLNNIMAAGKHRPLPIGIIGHGHLNMFHSRRQLVDTFFDYTNKENPLSETNRLSIVESQREEAYPIIQDDTGTHIFRAKPMHSFNVIHRLNEVLDIFIIDNVLREKDDVITIQSDYQTTLEAGQTAHIKAYEASHDEGFYFKKSVLDKLEAE